jgi:hypothetical protein
VKDNSVIDWAENALLTPAARETRILLDEVSRLRGAR